QRFEFREGHAIHVAADRGGREHRASERRERRRRRGVTVARVAGAVVRTDAEPIGAIALQARAGEGRHVGANRGDLRPARAVRGTFALEARLLAALLWPVRAELSE